MESMSSGKAEVWLTTNKQMERKKNKGRDKFLWVILKGKQKKW